MESGPRERLPAERKELPAYKLTIIVHRHGEKASIAGDLSEEGAIQAAEYFGEAYKNVPLDLEPDEGVDIVSSPISRTQQTAAANKEFSGARVHSMTTDERLSEGSIAHHRELFDKWGGVGGRWIPAWMALKERPSPEVKTGQEAVKDFINWLLEKIHDRQQKGGTQEIDAFSHFPVMIAFLLRVEELMQIKLLPKDWQLIDNSRKILEYIEYINMYTDSKEKDTLIINYRGQKVLLPIALLEKTT